MGRRARRRGDGVLSRATSRLSADYTMFIAAVAGFAIAVGATNLSLYNDASCFGSLQTCTSSNTEASNRVKANKGFGIALISVGSAAAALLLALFVARPRTTSRAFYKIPLTVAWDASLATLALYVTLSAFATAGGLTARDTANQATCFDSATPGTCTTIDNRQSLVSGDYDFATVVFALGIIMLAHGSASFFVKASGGKDVARRMLEDSERRL